MGPVPGQRHTAPTGVTAPSRFTQEGTRAWGSRGLGSWFLAPQGQAPCTTSEARFPDFSLPLPFWGGPASPFLRLASPWLLPGLIQKENGKCLISIWALTKWNFPSVMEVMSALGQARRDAQAHVLTAGHRAGCQPPEAAGT